MRLLPPSNDRLMGRWSDVSARVKSAGSHQRSLNFFSLYRATDSSNGDASAINQQQRILISQNRTQSPDEALLSDFLPILRKLHSSNDLIVIAGDFNCTKDHPFLTTLSSEANLSDAMTIHNANPPPTRQPGSKTIDHILVSPSLVPLVVSSHYYPFGYMVQSDHRPLVLELDLTSVMSNSPIILPTPRLLSSSHRQNSRLYRKLSGELLLTHRIHHKFRYLLDNPHNLPLKRCRKLLNALDRKHISLLRKAESAIPPPKQWPWSPRLILSTMIHAFWRQKTSLLHTITHSSHASNESLRAIIASKGADPFQGDQTRTSSSELRMARRRLARDRQNAHQLRSSFLTLQSANQSNQEKSKRILKILSSEQWRQIYRAFKSVDSPPRSSLSSIMVESQHNSKIVDNKSDIDEILHQYTKEHFSTPSRNGTPFLSKPLLTHLGFRANTQSASSFRTNPDH